jgi:hypothetical protein
MVFHITWWCSTLCDGVPHYVMVFHITWWCSTLYDGFHIMWWCSTLSDGVPHYVMVFHIEHRENNVTALTTLLDHCFLLYLPFSPSRFFPPLYLFLLLAVSVFVHLPPVYPLHVLCHPYLLTYSMVQSPSWEANWLVASQEIPRLSRNPKVHYRTHKRSPPVSILG